MVRRFPWCTVVALVVLLLVTTEGLRERSTQIDDHRITNRGTLRFSKSQEESSTEPSLSRSRTTRDRLSQSKRVSNLENRNEDSTLATVIASEPKFDSTKHSFVRTTRTTEIGSFPTLAETTNDLKRSPLTQNVEKTKKVESSNRRNGKRYSSGSNDGAKSKDNEQKIPAEPSKGFPRRTSNGSDSGATDRLDNKGPSVFLATTESSRSRTGRKIQTTFSTKDLKTQIPTSRRFNNKKSEDAETTTVSFRREGRGRSTTERVERSTRSGRSKVNSRENNTITRRGPDALSESESIRVDIPLTVDGTQSSLPDSTTSFGMVAQRRSDTKELPRSGTRTGSERSKGRGRSNDSETAGSSRSSSRRGSSKFNDFTTTEANEQIVSSRKNTVPRDRARGSEAKKPTTESRSRSRGRNLENSIKSTASGTLERDVKRKSQERSSSDRRSRIPDAISRFSESRGQDTQDARGRSRNRSRSDVTTPITTDVTTTVAPDTTVPNDVTTSNSEITSTTVTQATPMTTTSSPRPTRPPSTSTSTPESTGRGRGRGRGGSQGRKKEDFFNHGLGFRGRKPPPEGASNVSESRRTTSSKNDSQLHGNPGWTLRRRPGHFNNSENPPRNAIPSPRDQTNEVIPPNEQSTSTEAATTVESSTFSTRRGSKKLQTTEESSIMAETATKSSRRGNKTFGPGKGAAELEESDNYPPEFKARLNQLKNTNTKTPVPKTTSRAPLEDQLKGNYGRRSRNNSKAFEPDDLETAASGNVLTDESLVMNPLTLINGTGLRRVKKSTAALFAERSRMKLELARRLVKPELNIEENDLDATTASSFSKSKPSGVPPVVDETNKVAKYSKPPTATGRRGFVESSREEVSVKASKLSSSRKGLEDSSKVIGRPYNLKKGRIIAERMVTSISVEERAVDETTKPYVLTTKPSVITSASAEEGSATTIESTRIRLTGRERKKSKEEDSTTSDKNVKVSLQSNRRVENNEPVTTFKPKKPYVYQSRNSKLNSTSIEQSSTTIAPKKSYSPAERKSQTSQEENITKKSKFGSSASKPIFRPRYSKRTKQKSSEEKTADYQDTLTTKLPTPTSRYARKKSVVKAVDEKYKSATTEGSVTQSKKIEFRPRTATYRRHSEVPTTLVKSTTKVDGTRVAITPRSTRFHATLKTSTVSPQSVAQEPQVNLRIANESAQETPGITGSSNGDSGNTNIFNPTRSTFLTGNGTLLEQLRSTVAPLLNSLGNKTPVFSQSYSNVNNNANSAPRVTPNGQPPRFSARYKGAELFIRKQNNVYQPTVPSITSSSTTPVTPVENSGSAPPVDVSSPGEPKFLTLYEALESVSIRNEQLQGNASAQQQGQAGRVPQVDSNAAIANRIGDNANNDTTSPTVATTSPQTPDTTANTIQDSTQTPSLPEDTENSTPTVTTGAPETPSTTEPVFTSTEMSSSTEQASSTVSSTESPSSTEQVSTSTEMSSSSEQATSTVSSTESPSTTEQLSTSTDSLSTVQQTSTNSVPVTEQSSTESFAQTTSATTLGGPGDSQTSPPVDSSMNQEPVSSTDIPMVTSSAPEGSSTQVDEGTSTTVSSTEVQSTEAQSVTGEVDVASRMQDSQNLILETTTATTTVSDTPTINTSENPETNTIPFSDTTATQVPTQMPTQAPDASSTDASTTESESSNMIEVETTTAIPTSTTRNRLIDFAQDILSRLQASLSTTTISNQDSTTTISPATEISNMIPDSGSNSSLEALAQLTTETTTTQGESGTTQSSVTMDQSSLKTAEEVTTQSAVGSITTSSPTMVPTQEANTQDEMNAFTTTTPATITTSTQDSQTISNTDSTTVDDSNSTLSTPLGTEVTTASTVTSTNDTLLTELMSIAKTLLSEEMNDTKQVITQQNSNDTSRLGNIMENEIDVLSTTQAAESSSISPDVTTESVQSTPTTVAMSESSTSAVDPSQNEVDSIDPTTTVSSETPTDTPATVAQNNMPDNETQSVQTTESTTIALGPRIQNLESTTPSFTTEIGSQITLSNRGSFDLDTTTQSQTTITTQSSETTTTPGVNFELTTNTFDLFPSNLTTTTETISEDIAENVTEPTGITVPLTTVTSQLVTDTSTNQPEITTVETTPSLVNTITTTSSTSPEVNTEQTTVMSATVELVQRINDVDVETNQTTTEFAQLTIESDNETLEATMPSTTASQDSMNDGVTTNQSPLTSSTESIMGTTTNIPSETTVPQITPNLENETPTVVARFQDTTSATAQGTAGSGIGQTTEINTSMTSDSSTTPSSIPESSTSSSSLITTTSSVETTTATMTTETTTSTSIGRVPGGASMPQTTRMDVVTITPMTETTTVSPDSMTTMSGLMSTQQGAMNDSMSVTTEGSTMSETTTMSTQTTPGTSMPTSTMPPSSTSASQTSTPPYIGRFGSSRLTPAPRFSLSSTTRAPLRDYLVYGIYPNKTIVRKRPEDNLIDARNVDSPYVIFGIFPDGRLVRKFPNGTIIPDPPRSPVEVVFSLSTSTTTNRPPPRPYYNQANQGTYNQYQDPVYNNNGRPVAVPMRNVQSPGTVDLGLTGNAIVGPNGGGPDNTGPLGTPGIPSTNEMSNALLNTQMGTASVTPIVSTGRPPTDSQGGRIVQDRERDEATRTKEAGGQRSSVYIGQDKFVNYWTDGASTTNPRVLSVNINSVAAGANEGPSTSIPSFENLLNNQPGGRVTAPPGFPWRDPLDQIFGITTSSPIMTASVASNRLDDSSGSNNPALTRPINPFVEVFTPFSSAIGVQKGNIGTLPPPPSTTTVTSTTSAPSTTTTTTMAPTTTTTTTMAPTTTTTTTMAPTTTTTTTMAPTTTTTTMAPTTTTTTTMAPTTTTMASTTTAMAAPATIDQRANIVSQTASPETTSAASPQTTPFNIPKNLLNAQQQQQQQQDAFGTTFDDLAFLNSLLQSNSRSTTQKTLTQVEQLLANKILSLALNNPGPTRAPKAVSIENATPNSLFQSPTRSPSEPIVIDLSPSSTAAAPAWKSPEIEQPTSQKSILNSLTSEQVTWKPVTTTTTATKKDIEISTTSPSTTAKTTLISTTKVPVTVTTKRVTTQRPRTTTQAPLGFAGLLWQTLGGLFGPSTTPKPVKSPKPVKTTQKSVNITPKPIQTTQRLETITTKTPSTTTLRTLDVSKIHVSTPNSIVQEERSVTTPIPISTTKRSLLNNPNPRLPSVVTSTYSPEDDAKFLVELLRAVQQENKSGAPKKTGSVQDDESFLRAILSGKALTTTPSPPTEISNAALLAALLKAQGIEPPTPAIDIREQLQSASLGQSVTSAPAGSPSSESTTITTRPASAATRPPDSTKKSVTPRPTSRPRIRTTTWSPSSTYPPPFFSSFSNYGTPAQSADSNDSGNGALFGATRAFSQFLGAAISGAAQQLQSLVRNGTRIVSEAVG